jgi:hypothetical protein
MSDTVIRLTILLGILFGSLAMIGVALYLSIAVLKFPLLVIVLVGVLASGLVALFLKFVGKMSPAREGHHHEW